MGLKFSEIAAVDIPLRKKGGVGIFLNSTHPKYGAVRGCQCEYCNWIRAKDRKPGSPPKVVSPPASHPKKSRSVRGCQCEYCNWRRDRNRKQERVRKPQGSRSKIKLLTALVTRLLTEKKISEADLTKKELEIVQWTPKSPS